MSESGDVIVSARVDPLVPNAETIAAIEAARRGETEVVTLDELQSALDADD
ncbi:MAG: hypothetical protein ACLPN5_04645 [Roseiarcus sp.]